MKPIETMEQEIAVNEEKAAKAKKELTYHLGGVEKHRDIMDECRENIEQLKKAIEQIK